MCQSGNDAIGCHSASFTTYNITFNKICGQVKGYQKGSPDRFHSTKYDTKSINDHYVDGLSIKLGNPRKHMWTYVIGLSDDFYYPDFNYPCTAIPGPDPPDFVDDHYYCESDNTGTFSTDEHYTSDVLWDGYGCHHAAVSSLVCLGSSDSFHSPCMIFLRQGSATKFHSLMNILLLNALNCTYSDITDIYTFIIDVRIYLASYVHFYFLVVSFHYSTIIYMYTAT